jgi:transcription-repair coupling factor (superfamily II helicase)
LPDVRFGIAHGKIDEDELSEIWRQLVDREIDVLVCTTLIETGVDVPNVNTLIIEDADRMGLSQLYQLRGRVGRSNRRALAYFTFRRGKVLSEIAQKRLDAIREFTQFGSGFHIAMRDLEIRGAGSVLSGKQHGHMEAVGYDMYIRLLNEAIAEQKGEAPPPSPEDCLVDISIDAFIPESYIENASQRIDAYRKIASIANVQDSRDVIDEMIDRYGEPPKAVMGLINVALTRNRALHLRITEIVQRGEKVFFYIAQPDISQIKALSGRYKNRIRFVDSDKAYFAVALDKKQPAHELMAQVIDTMEDSAETKKEG